jgi:hypothetical protein
MSSSFLSGVGDDAARLADYIDARGSSGINDDTHRVAMTAWGQR